MSSLDFIGMTKLKDELVNVFDDEKDSEEVEELPIKDNFIKGENLEMIDSNEINYDMARNSLEDVYDSQEHQLPDPTYEEGDDSSSSEEIGEEEKTDENEIGSEIVSEKVKAYMIEKSEKVPSSVKIAKGKTTIVSHEVGGKQQNNKVSIFKLCYALRIWKSGTLPGSALTGI